MKTLIIAAAFGAVLSAVHARNPQVEGYWGNWVDVSWWSTTMPGNCMMGCTKPAPFMSKIENYSTVNYGFTVLSQNMNSSQVGCGETWPNGPCPAWDGKAIYAAKSTMEGAVVVSDTIPGDGSSCIPTGYLASSPGLIGIGETCRLARGAPGRDAPARCRITLGGWSDWAALGTVDNARALAKLVGKMVLHTVRTTPPITLGASSMTPPIPLRFPQRLPRLGIAHRSAFAPSRRYARAVRRRDRPRL